MKKIIILVSGNGSNMESIIKSCQNKSIHDTEVTLVISNKNNALALKKANNLGVKTKILENACFPCRELYDQELLNIIKQYDCDLIILAGFMRILTPKFIDAFKNKIINDVISLKSKVKGQVYQRKIGIDFIFKLSGMVENTVRLENALDYLAKFVKAVTQIEKRLLKLKKLNYLQ